MSSVLGIYARETGQGMIFSHDSDKAEHEEDTADLEPTPSRPHLRIVK